MRDHPVRPPRESGDGWDEEPIRPGAPLDWEALRADGKVHLFFYLRDQVVALALSDAAG
jgi:hypothetical protein